MTTENKYRSRFFVVMVMLFSFLLAGIAQAAQTVTYFHTDALGSAVAASDESGALVWRKSYSPYGEKVSDGENDQNAIAYTGKKHDEITGLTYFGARYYDPEVGRFMGMDAVGFKGSNPMSFNRYAYANDNPFKYIDPDGREVVANEEAAIVIEQLESGSKTAREIMSRLRGSDNTYTINIDSESTSGNSGFNSLTRTIDIKSNVIGSGTEKVPDTEGGSFAPSVSRVLGHEIGHADVLERTNRRFAKTPAGGREATGLENKIAKEINPNAPTRDESGDGHKPPPKE